MSEWTPKVEDFEPVDSYKRISTGDWGILIDPRKELGRYVVIPDPNGVWFQNERGVVCVVWNADGKTTIGVQSGTGGTEDDLRNFERQMFPADPPTPSPQNTLARDKWGTMTAEEQYSYMRLCENESNSYRSVLEEIPECPRHGFCTPHYRQWIREHKAADPPAQPANDDEARIAAIRERLAKITPGEWYSGTAHEFDTVRVRMPDRPEGDPVVAQMEHQSHHISIGIVTAWWLPKDARRPYQAYNAEFIAAAPEAERYLLERLDAVTKRAERAEKFFADVDSLTVLSSTVQFMNGVNELLAAFTLADEGEYHRIWETHRTKEPTDDE